MDERPTLTRSRVVLGMAATALLILIVVTALLSATRSLPHFEAGTPEAAAQAYLRALLDGEEGVAHGYLTEEVQAECGVTAFRDIWMPDSVRITLAATTVVGDTAEVDLEVAEGIPGPFGGGGRYDVTLALARSAGGWFISEPPWPLEHCEMERF